MKQWNVLTETLDRHMLKSIWDNATKYALEYMIKNVMKLEQYKKRTYRIIYNWFGNEFRSLYVVMYDYDNR